MNRKTLVLPAVVGLLAPVLAACGGSEGEGDAIVVGTTDQFSSSSEAPAPFDPAIGYEAGVWNVLRQTVQTLTHIPRGGGEPVPEAARSCAFTDTENESYRCTLRAGLTFADGTPVTPDDVKYSIQRVLDIEDEAGPVGLLANIDTMETKGEDQIVFHLKTPDATFPYKLATPAAGIVQKDKYPAKSPREGFEVDGSGPYTMKPEVKGDQVVKMVFTKNPKYKGDVKILNNKVELDLYPDAVAMGKALEDGEIDMMTRTMSPEQAQKMLQDPVDGIKLTEMPGLAISYMAFNTEDPAVKDKAVRQAMAQIIDRGAIASGVYGTTAEPLYSLIPSGITNHTNSFFNKYGEPDVDEAGKILERAGISTPVKFTLHYTTDHYGPATAAEYKALGKQLNDSKLFEVDVKGTPWAKYRAAQSNGDYAVYGMGWFPDFPDPDTYTAPFLDKNNFLNSPYESTLIQDTLIPESRRVADRSAAAETFSKIQDIVATDVPVLPVWQGKQYVASRDGLTGVEWAVTSSADLQLWELKNSTG
ncbi:MULTISPECIES: ABC transporter substrate-binding protein [Streptomyces]|uniref:ABC transporter substrate-binding protein n=1 Tax=Streptomyces TaxID=1883 RepID=UPI0007003B3D|nr:MULTISPECIES: ABC transporter substrate-binding protein [Streptomyces]KQX90011.1 peptide-binding protein [Streptomyces sp. Root1319]KQZ20741.1 peptide-binding protein [Streptomyces sp. Root55]MDX3064541.1 ABC transporter substrate-binding protein [Streptomyces sp. ND04-05B]WUC26947.1 ABC transporter substrate-binding protein [Streptomyces clavifer]